MDEKRKMIRWIMIFIGVAYGISGVGYWIWYKIHPLGALLTIFGPLVGALCVIKVSGKKVKPYLKQHAFIGMGVGMLMPFLYFLLIWSFAIIKGYTPMWHNLSLVLIVGGVCQWAFAGFCEEIGWRGVLLPMMKQLTNSFWSCVAVSVIWFGWHVPMILNGDIMTSFPICLGMLYYFIEVLGITWMMDTLSNTKFGKSIWVYVSFHAMHNILAEVTVALFKEVPPRLIRDGGYVLNSCILIVAVCLMVYVRKSRFKLARNKEE